MARIRKLSPEEIVSLKNFIEEYFEYDGRNFWWKKSRSGIKVGQQAGTLSSYGYRRIAINRKWYMEHRFVWLYVEGYYPQDGEDIDHLNGIRDDNRRENLTLVSRSCNMQKQHKRKDNISGVIGVCWKKDMKKMGSQNHNKRKVNTPWNL